MATKNLNETNVICPNCGAKVAIPNHEHAVLGMCIGKDSGLGNVYLQLEDRKSQLEERGIDTDKYFSIKSPSGDDVLMKWENGIPSKVDDDDPVIAAIRKAYVPNRRLFRRWVMAQMFRGLSHNGGFTSWMKFHGYLYTWKQMIEELRVQAILYRNDKENYDMRQRWFNHHTLLCMCNDYIAQLEKYIDSRTIRKCKGRPYKRIFSGNVFVDEIEKYVVYPLRRVRNRIMPDCEPDELYRLAKEFRNIFPNNHEAGFVQSVAWQDAFKGAGAYFTLRNLIMFHGCVWEGCTGIDDSLHELDEYAAFHEGYEVLGALKAVIKNNGIDIEAKMKEWKK